MYIMCVPCTCRPEEGVRSYGTGVYAVVSSDVGVGMNTGPLEEQLSHFSSLSDRFSFQLMNSKLARR